MSNQIQDIQQPSSAKKNFLKAKGICVVLEDDISKADIKHLITAIEQLKNVQSAKFIDYEGFDDYINRVRVRDEFRDKLKKVIGL